MASAGQKRSSGEFAGTSPPPKDSKLGELSPTSIDIDSGKLEVDETHGLAPQLGNTPSKPAGGETEAVAPAWAQAMKTDIIAGLRGVVHEEIAPLKQEVNELSVQLSATNNKVEQIDINAKAALAAANEAKAMIQDDSLAKKVADLENLVKGLKISPSDSVTAMIGNLDEASSVEAAKSWLSEVFRKASVDGVVDIYPKMTDDKFNGRLFVKFSSSEKRNAAIRSFRSQRTDMAGKKPFMNEDLPLNERVPLSFLARFKRVLTDDKWGYARQSVKYDADTRILSVGGDDVVSAITENHALKLTWISKSWGEWKELQDSDELQNIIQELDSKLTEAQKRLDKGKGKGPVGKA